MHCSHFLVSLLQTTYFVVRQRNIISIYNYDKDIHYVGNGFGKPMKFGQWNASLIASQNYSSAKVKTKQARITRQRSSSSGTIQPASLKDYMITSFIVSAARTQCPTLFCIAIRYYILTWRRKLKYWNEKRRSLLGRFTINVSAETDTDATIVDAVFVSTSLQKRFCSNESALSSTWRSVLYVVRPRGYMAKVNMQVSSGSSWFAVRTLRW